MSRVSQADSMRTLDKVRKHWCYGRTEELQPFPSASSESLACAHAGTAGARHGWHVEWQSGSAACVSGSRGTGLAQLRADGLECTRHYGMGSTVTLTSWVTQAAMPAHRGQWKPAFQPRKLRQCLNTNGLEVIRHRRGQVIYSSATSTVAN